MYKRYEDINVIPGEELGVIEEFLEGRGVYQKNGIIRSEEFGTVNYDLKNHIVIVKKITPHLTIPVEGDTVIAEVGSIARRDARVDIFKVEDNLIFPSFSAVIHISDISKQYVRNIDMAIRSGDIIKAIVVNTKNRLNQLSIKGEEYGVIYAYCSRCGEILVLSKDRLRCLNCDRTERRQIAKNYGAEELV